VTSHKFGDGRVFWGVSLREILRSDGIVPDFEYAGAADERAFIDFIHRTTDDAELYFVANRENRPASLDCTFRVGDRVPEIWDPVTGSMSAAKLFRHEAGRTVVPIEFAPHQSFFVVFPRAALAGAATPSSRDRSTGIQGAAVVPTATASEWPAGRRPLPYLRSVQTLTGSWTVKFDPEWGGPAAVEFATLDDWIQRPEASIRHYSGTATYVKRFDLADEKSGPLHLDLGTVRNIAEIRLNGQRIGILWTAPWQLEITEAVKPTDNLLEIEVVNLWPNRLIGDAALPPEKRLTNTNIETKTDAPLLSSGLLGPVVLKREISAR
jgi:hypothetical protein